MYKNYCLFLYRYIDFLIREIIYMGFNGYCFMVNIIIIFFDKWKYEILFVVFIKVWIFERVYIGNFN